MSAPPHVLYLSFNGILEPLGYSQVARVVRRLSDRGGARFTLCTLEKRHDIDTLNHQRVAAELAAAGVTWDFRGFNNGVRGVIANVQNMHLMALNAAAEDQVRLIHARSYLSAQVATTCRALLGIPYLFDFRGYWVDELSAEGRWITTSLANTLAKHWERKLFQKSAGIVSLATPAIDDIKGGMFGELNQPTWVIPTCVDEEEFSLDGRDVAKRELGLEGRLVIGFVGSLNASYRVDESLRLVRELMELRDDVSFVGLTHQPEALHDKLREHRLDAARILVRSIGHAEIPQWLRAIDWGLLLLHTRSAKRASMPTKLAEFLASGVRPIHHGCNDEVTQWVQRCGSGISLPSCDADSLRGAAEQVASIGVSKRHLVEAREIAMPHFSLTAGIEQYERCYEHLLAR